MIKIYLANLGAYNRGHLVGEWLELPMDEKDLEIEIDDILNGEDAKKSRDFKDVEDEEYAIHDYECDFMSISEYESIKKLNYLAEELENLDDFERDTIKAVMEAGFNNDLEDVIDNIDSYHLYTDIENENDLGQFYLNESDIPDYLRGYIDYDSYGRDCQINENGAFTDYGYVRSEK